MKIVYFLISLGLSGLSYSSGKLWQVKYFVNPQDQRFVAIDAGVEQGLNIDDILNVYRKVTKNATSEAPYVRTGRIKIKVLEKNTSVAEIVEQGSQHSKAVFAQFPYVMSGDLLEHPAVAVRPIKDVTPERTLYYANLFEDPQANPQTFELSSDGVLALETVAKEFMRTRAGNLLIKGYTDQVGAKAVNQVESYQRALTVKQFLVNRFKFDERRIIAIGLGEKDLLDSSNISGQGKYNRRLVLKVIPF